MAHLQNFRDSSQCSEVCNGIGAFLKIDQHAEKTTPNPQSVASGDSLQNDSGWVKGSSYDPHTPTQAYDIPQLKPGSDGQIDWSPMADLTGIRSTKHPLDRHSVNEWKKHNKEVLDETLRDESNYVFFNGKSAICQAYGNTDEGQLRTFRSLKRRARDVFRWKAEFEQSCRAIASEITLLENERQRIKQACKSLLLAESIYKECFDLRSNRSNADLVSDLAELELFKEKALVTEVEDSFFAALKEVEEQLAADKAAKQTADYWCTNKGAAYDCDSANLGLTPKSNTIIFKPGAVKYAEKTTSPEMCDDASRQTLLDIEAARQRSIVLREKIVELMKDCAKKLKLQADTTDIALVKTVAENKRVYRQMDLALKETLEKIADMEIMIEQLHSTIFKMDSAMKLAQTRLDNRNNMRPHVENVRDPSHQGLIQEVKTIHETVSHLRGQLTNVQNTRKQLMAKRLQLETDLAAKLKSINIDGERCKKVRSHYPEVADMLGYQ